jgi:hypothetical protein
MYEFFFAKIMAIQLNTHEYILGPPLVLALQFDSHLKPAGELNLP